MLPALVPAAALAVCWALAGCSSRPDIADLQVGDCVQLGGTPDRPQASKAACGSPQSNFKVVAAVADRAQCPADVDSSYSRLDAVSGTTTTVCLDIDWVIGGCMSIDPRHAANPLRVDCNDASVPNRQRATQILENLDAPVSVDQCASGVGYTYNQRRFAVCVEDVSGGPPP